MAGVSMEKTGPTTEQGSLQQLCDELQDGLERAFERQRQAQQELIAEFLRRAGGTGTCLTHQPTAVSFQDNKAQTFESLQEFTPPPPDTTLTVTSVCGVSGTSKSMRTTESTQAAFESVQENSMQNDIEWLHHAVLQPRIRSTPSRILMEDQLDKTNYVQPLLDFYDWWMALKEPERQGCIKDIVVSRLFSFVCCLMIVLNGVLIVHHTDMEFRVRSQGRNIGASERSVYTGIEIAFVVFYALELGLRIWVHRQYFFANEDAGWNFMDFFLVFTSCVDLSLSMAIVDAGDMNISFLRVLRLLKLSKVFRLFRAVKFFTELRLMLDCLFGCLAQLFWAMMLILLFVTLFSIFFVQGMTSSMEVRWSELTPAEIADMSRTFGSVEVGMNSLFQATSGGRDWVEIYDMLAKAGELYSSSCIIYICFMSIAVLNIVTSMFVDRAMRLAKPTEQELIAEREQKTKEDTKWLLQLCDDLKIDSNGDGFLDYADIKRCMTDVEVRGHFDTRGICFEDTHSFYQMLLMATKFQGVDIQTFVTGCLRLQGEAKGIDLHTMAFELKLMHRERAELGKRMTAMDRYCREQFSKLSDSIRHIRHGVKDHRLDTSSAAATPANGNVDLADREKVERTVREMFDFIKHNLNRYDVNQSSR